MTDEQKFNLCGKLCHDVLGGVVDDVIPYDADSSAILQDTFTILCCKVGDVITCLFHGVACFVILVSRLYFWIAS